MVDFHARKECLALGPHPQCDRQCHSRGTCDSLGRSLSNNLISPIRTSLFSKVRLSGRLGGRGLQPACLRPTVHERGQLLGARCSTRPSSRAQGSSKQIRASCSCSCSCSKRRPKPDFRCVRLPCRLPGPKLRGRNLLLALPAWRPVYPEGYLQVPHWQQSGPRLKVLRCKSGYYGARCEFSKCVVPCLNGGVCRLGRESPEVGLM